MKNKLFEETPIPAAYLKLAVPVMMSMVLMLVYNMVDMYFIAKTGNTDLIAGVSLCAPIFIFTVAIGDIFGLGSSSVISRLFGQGRTNDGKRLSVFAFWGAAAAGLIIGIAMLVLRIPLLHLLGADADTMQYASSYYIWIAAGAPFAVFSLVPTNLMRSEGFASAAMIGSVTGSVVNIILDPLFIFTFGLGAAGAAIATVIGNICADCFYVWFISTHSKALTLNPKGFFISGEEIRRILEIGFPSSITNIMASVSTTLLNRFLLPYGNDKIAVMGIVMKIVMIVNMIVVALSFGGQPMYGYLYGAGNRTRMKATIRFAYSLVFTTAVVLAAILFLFAPQMISIYMNSPDVIAAGTPMLRRALIGMPFTAVVIVTTCIFQSTGKAAGAFLLSAGRQGYMFAAVLLIVSSLFGYVGVITAQPIADAFTAVLAILLYRKFIAGSIENPKEFP